MMNDIGLSFAMLSLVEKAHKLVEWEFLIVEITIREGLEQKSKVFYDLEVGFY